MRRGKKKKNAYRQRLSAYAIVFTSRCLSVLPIAIASAIAGKIVRFFGPLSREHKIGDANLQRCLPHISPVGRREILAGMWENIGRAFGEMPHLDKILNDPARFSFDGLDDIVAELVEGQGVVTVTGHFGNWELSPAPSYRLGRRQVSFYRKPRNPHLEEFLLRHRRRICTGELVASGDASLRRAMQAVSRGEFVGMAVDQRESQGVTVPFFGAPAPTNHAPALLALRYGAPLLAGRVIREKGVTFRLDCKRIPVQATGNRLAAAVKVTAEINNLFEQWIREKPEQWLWLNRRW